MIYSIINNKLISEHHSDIGFGELQNRAIATKNLSTRLDDSDSYGWKICIPKKYARMESKKRVTPENVHTVDCYEIYITRQIGSSRNRRNTFIYIKFPNHDKLFTVILYADGGVGFAKHDHKYVLRVSDEIDRRIILGFCRMYQHNLTKYCYEDTNEPDRWILYNASSYTIDQMPKRIKSGSEGNSIEYRDLKPYEEHYSIFNNIVIV